MKKYLFIAVSLIVFGCNSSIVDDPYTSIHFTILEAGNVKLTVENAYDTQIAILIDSHLEAGDYQAGFDMSELAEGIYFYTIRITQDNGKVIESTKRFLLIKLFNSSLT